MHADCISGGLRTGMSFAPDKACDAESARLLNERVAHETHIQTASTVLSVDGVAGGLEPPTLDMPLPAYSWFSSLSWDDLRSISGNTYVQVPKRLEFAFAEAIGVAL